MKCLVPGCQSYSGNGIKFCAFPSSISLRKKWLEVVNRVNAITTNSYICEKHFRQEDWEHARVDGAKKLRRSAVPSLNLPASQPIRRVFGDISNVPICHSSSLPLLEIGSSTITGTKTPASSPQVTTLGTKKLFSVASLPNLLTAENRKEVDLMNKSVTPPSFLPARSLSDPGNWCAEQSLRIDHNYFKKSRAIIPTSVILDHSYGLKSHKTSDQDTRLDNSLIHDHSYGLKSHKTTDHDTRLDNSLIHDHSYGLKSHETTDQDARLLDNSLLHHGYRQNFNSPDPTPATDLRIVPVASSENISTDASTICAESDEVPSEFVTANTDFETVAPSETENLNRNASPTCAESDKVPSELIKSSTDFQNTPIRELEKRNKMLEEKLRKYERVLKQNITLQKSVAKARKEKMHLKNCLATVQKNFTELVTEDQFQSLCRNSTRGFRWSEKTIQEALSFKSMCGSSAYSEIAKRFRFPSLRTLHRRTESITFESGILDEVFARLALDVVKLKDQERDCMIALDEMAIKPNDKLIDPSTKKPIGHCTLPGHSGPANKALVFMIGGLTTRWKQVVAYYFTHKKDKAVTSHNSTGNAMKDILLQIIDRAETSGLKVHAVTSDMGSDNRAMWAALGITASKYSPTVSSIQHPCRPDSQLFFLPDAPHLFKSIKSMLIKHPYIILPEKIVAKYKLPTNAVLARHIVSLLDHEDKFELKVAHRLKKSDLDGTGHFESMHMGRARAVINHRVKVGLNLMAKRTKRAELQTTAWFISLVNRWFDLITCRSPVMALSNRNPDALAEALEHLRLTCEVFRDMKIGREGHWKPCQQGMLLVYQSIVGLQADLLGNRGYKFFLTSRLTQDCLENLFSRVRRKQRIPDALQFKYILRDITLSRQCTASWKGGYDVDEGEMLASMISEGKKRASEKNSVAGQGGVLLTYPVLTAEDIYAIDNWELCVMYDMAGAAIRKTMTLHKIKSCFCIDALLWDKPHPHPFSEVTREKDYKEGAQLRVSNECFVAIVKTEITFRMLRVELLKSDSIQPLEILIAASGYIWDEVQVPECKHDFKSKLLKKYLSLRFKQYSGRKDESTNQSATYSSKTLAASERTKNLQLNYNKKKKS